jgi:hypothetical protein
MQILEHNWLGETSVVKSKMMKILRPSTNVELRPQSPLMYEWMQESHIQETVSMLIKGWKSRTFLIGHNICVKYLSKIHSVI